MCLCLEMCTSPLLVVHGREGCCRMREPSGGCCAEARGRGAERDALPNAESPSVGAEGVSTPTSIDAAHRLRTAIPGLFRTLCLHPGGHPVSSIWVYRAPRSLFTPSSSSLFPAIQSSSCCLFVPALHRPTKKKWGCYFFVPQTSDLKFSQAG